ncbi:sulfite exporter TauE/SafE family protein [Streptomyces olivaceus]|uniref:sulfite exporter TauE/SafE family protein n=1 Tax=Streptomyces TaxID=1883 RepID=UPI0018A80B2C|nr:MULTISPECIES: sulfite exporter TauE/SafE family protein [Streptomyces]MBF8174439.1 sulfite exporter TauE/SafE family protein [Streptomyces olivaceus]MBZ6129471.1 sulfite exporter TauE/SafE family protein [Streptomyces olivaceus]MBZ6247025.1 sulfite exporter TauE/SafE family protein [Streptomyces olivaceus]UOG80794.1 sulfite exporter TauE/SafE family protein [Streptomyces sp. CB09030]
MAGASATVLIALGLLGLVGGIGITAVGPGGVLPTIGLFALTSLSPAQVAGTAVVTHVATGALATAAYTRSGQLREPATRRTAVVLSLAALAGTPLGVLVNSSVSKRMFGIVLGVLVAGAAGLVLLRERRAAAVPRAHPSTPTVAVLGFSVAVAAGIVGIGGPMLTVPLLVALGVPVLESLAAAQAQSVVVAGVGTLGYVAHGAVDWPLAALVGVPELAGVLLGWRIARALPARHLKYALVTTLFALAPYLALHG